MLMLMCMLWCSFGYDCCIVISEPYTIDVEWWCEKWLSWAILEKMRVWHGGPTRTTPLKSKIEKNIINFFNTIILNQLLTKLNPIQLNQRPNRNKIHEIIDESSPYIDYIHQIFNESKNKILFILMTKRNISYIIQINIFFNLNSIPFK